MGSSGVVGFSALRVVVFTRVRLGCRWVHPESLGSHGFALGVVGLIRGRWVHSCSPWGRWVYPGLLGSLDFVVGFSRVHACVRWVHPWSLCSLGLALVSLGSLGSLGFVLGVVRFMQGRCVHSGSRSGSLGSSGVVRFTQVRAGGVGFTSVRAGGRWVHPGSLGSVGFALGVVGFIRGRWIPSGSPWGSFGSLGGRWVQVVGFTWLLSVGRCVHPWSFRSLGFSLGVVGYIRGRWIYSGSLCGPLSSSGVVGFTRFRPRCHWVHPGSLDSLGFALGVVGFILGRWVH